MREDMWPIFVNCNGLSGSQLVTYCLGLLGGIEVSLATNASVGKVPNDRPAFAQPDFDPERHVLTGVHWAGYIDANTLLEQRFDPFVDFGTYGASHMLHTPAAARMCEALRLRMILVVREPKDWACATARRILANPQPYGRPTDTTFEQHIRDCVMGFASTGTVGRLSIVERYGRMAQWLDYPFVALVSYENLVGASDNTGTAQGEAVRRIVQHVGLEPAPGLIDRIVVALRARAQPPPDGPVGSWIEQAQLFEAPDIAPLCLTAGRNFGYA
jgi:hypothetical protein